MAYRYPIVFSLFTSIRRTGLSLAGLAFMLGAAGQSWGYVDNRASQRTDAEFQGAIEQRLRMDTRIDMEHIGVTVEDKTATLFGTARTLEERALAGLIAGSVVGVTALKNTLRVAPEPGADVKVANAIKEGLRAAGLLPRYALTVDVRDGQATLGGTVENRRERRQARRAAESVPGVTSVTSAIKVAGQARSDEEIKRDVVDYLRWSPLVDAKRLGVTVRDGVVAVSGVVEHLAYRDALAIDLEHIVGVEDVDVSNIAAGPVLAGGQAP